MPPGSSCSPSPLAGRHRKPPHAVSMLTGASPSSKCFKCTLVTRVNRRALRAFFFFSRASRLSITCRGAGLRPAAEGRAGGARKGRGRWPRGATAVAGYRLDTSDAMAWCSVMKASGDKAAACNTGDGRCCTHKTVGQRGRLQPALCCSSHLSCAAPPPSLHPPPAAALPPTATAPAKRQAAAGMKPQAWSSRHGAAGSGTHEAAGSGTHEAAGSDRHEGQVREEQKSSCRPPRRAAGQMETTNRAQHPPAGQHSPLPRVSRAAGQLHGLRTARGAKAF